LFQSILRFKGTIINLYIVTSSYILAWRHDHVLSFISIYFSSVLPFPYLLILHGAESFLRS